MKTTAYNPYLPSWEYIPDGEPYVFDGRVYVYGSHDYYNGHVFCLGDYVCWSAPTDDLGNWCYEGVIYPKVEDPLNREGKMCLFAPDVTLGPDGRYYLYYVLDRWDGSVLAEIKVQYTNVWENYTADLQLPDGKQAIYFTYRGPGKAELKSFCFD